MPPATWTAQYQGLGCSPATHFTATSKQLFKNNDIGYPMADAAPLPSPGLTENCLLMNLGFCSLELSWQGLEALKQDANPPQVVIRVWGLSHSPASIGISTAQHPPPTLTRARTFGSSEEQLISGIQAENRLGVSLCHGDALQWGCPGTLGTTHWINDAPSKKERENTSAMGVPT